MSVDLLPGKPVSLWLARADEEPRPPVMPGHLFDVAILGGGIVGIMTAYELLGAGRSVAILESGRLLRDVTGHTTAKLTSQHGLVYGHLTSAFGAEAARLYYEANEWAIRRVHELASELQIECDFEWDSAHIFALKQESRSALERELEALAKLDIHAKLIVQPPLPFENFGAVQFEHQARYHPYKFLSGVVRQIESAGGQVYENTRVTGLEEEADRCRIQTDQGEVFATAAIVATHYPIFDSGLFVAKLAPYRSYVLAARIRGDLPSGMFLSHEENPMYSLRRATWEGEDLLIVGGEMHKVGQMDDADGCYRRLEAWLRMHFDVQSVVFRWSTQDNFTPDRVPYVGPSPGRSRIFLATGFGGWGMTNGIVSGRILRDAVQGDPNPWSEIYRPNRLDLAMIPKVVTENLNAAAKLIGDRVAGTSDRKLHDLGIGEAAIVSHGSERVAGFRAEDGTIHAVSAICPHMGCQVHWNSAECTWDCPCHGSRFTVDGQVLHGPAVDPLHAVDSTPEPAA